MTALIVLLCLTLAALAAVLASMALDLRAIRRRQNTAHCRAMRHAGIIKEDRVAQLRQQGLSIEEIAQAEEDAQ